MLKIAYVFELSDRAEVPCCCAEYWRLLCKERVVGGGGVLRAPLLVMANPIPLNRDPLKPCNYTSSHRTWSTRERYIICEFS
jgi:hypothetical protein